MTTSSHSSPSPELASLDEGDFITSFFLFLSGF